MIYIETETEFASTDLPERAARTALEHQAAPEGDITIVLTDDARLRELNRYYLGIDAPTDVLSFPAHQTDPDTGRLYLGDILVSLPRAARQAKAAGHPLESEVQRIILIKPDSGQCRGRWRAAAAIPSR